MVMTARLITDKGGPALPQIKRHMRELRAAMKDSQVRFVNEGNKFGRMAGRWMADKVRATVNRRGNTGELAKALEEGTSFKRAGRAGFQVTLNTGNLPVYWAMINYGGFVSPEYVYGIWNDSADGHSKTSKRGGVGTGQFDADKDGFLMTPRKPIKGFHYITYAYIKMLSYTRSQVGKKVMLASTKIR